ncbi:MAG: hypothetical protein ABIN36_04130 [Ferruginibacter sp.]
MRDLRTLVDELNQLILEGKILEGFEKFYSEEVVMQDNDYPQRIVRMCAGSLRKNL